MGNFMLFLLACVAFGGFEYLKTFLDKNFRGKTFNNCKTIVKVGLYVSSIIHFGALYIFSFGGAEKFGNAAILALVVAYLILWVLGILAAAKIWNSDGKILTLGECSIISFFNFSFLIPYWLLGGKAW